MNVHFYDYQILIKKEAGGTPVFLQLAGMQVAAVFEILKRYEGIRRRKNGMAGAKDKSKKND